MDWGGEGGLGGCVRVAADVRAPRAPSGPRPTATPRTGPRGTCTGASRPHTASRSLALPEGRTSSDAFETRPFKRPPPPLPPNAGNPIQNGKNSRCTLESGGFKLPLKAREDRKRCGSSACLRLSTGVGVVGRRRPWGPPGRRRGTFEFYTPLPLCAMQTVWPL